MREEMGGKKGINRRGGPTLRRKHARLEFMASRRDGKFSTAKKLSKNKEARETRTPSNIECRQFDTV